MKPSLLPVITFFLAAALRGAAGAATFEAPEVELTRPAPGESLVGGSEMIVEWKLTGERLDNEIEEWEAFLSFNGGDYYAVRITPHLDISHRRFAFKVPDLATDNARILLRFGDEKREEISVEIPHVFSILPGFARTAHWGHQVLSRGESARPGDPGVVAWVEGSRQGDDLERFEAAPQNRVAGTVSGQKAEPASALTRRNSSLNSARDDHRAQMNVTTAALEVADRPRTPTPILLLCCRQNK